MNNLRVVVLAHVFPRTLDDSMGAFLLHLADALAERGAQIEVVAPHAKNLADAETLGAARVHRFHYAPANWERLAYQGTLHDLVAGGIANKILFAFFNLAYLWKAICITRNVIASREAAKQPLKEPREIASSQKTLLAMTKPALIHAHWWLPGGLVGALAALVTRVPLVVTTHGTDVEMLRRTRWAKPLARFVFARAHTITCGSNYLREQLLSLGVADASKVSVVPMPVNPLFQNSDFRIQISDRTILTVARLTKQKSIDTLINAIALVPDARLDIIGDGPERKHLEQQTRNLNLQDRVEFLGALPQIDLPKHYATCGVFVLPSIREGMGLVLAEALLCGAPVIAANSGGVTDIVQDGETGLLVPERDTAALADAIEKLLNDRALAQRLAQTGAARVRARYTRERVAEQFAEIYQRSATRRQMTTSSQSKIENRKSKTRQFVGYVLAVVVLFFLARLLVQTWGDLTATGFQFQFDLPRLIISLILLVVARGFAVEAWRQILISLGEYFTFGFGTRVWFLSNLTRYVPGNIWQVATMMVMVEQRGVSKTNALLSQALYTALALALAGLLGLLFVVVRPATLAGLLDASIAASAPIIAAIGLTALVIVFALPLTHRVIVALIARVLHREINAPAPTFARGIVPPIFSLLMWLTNGVAFYLFTSSITSTPLEQLPAFIAMNAGAYWIGYVSFITPSGLGFREGALAWMLSSFFPAPFAIALSLLARLWTTAGELLGVTLVWISKRETTR